MPMAGIEEGLHGPKKISATRSISVHLGVETCSVTSASGKMYLVILTVCSSGMTYIYTMKSKIELLKCFSEFCAMVGKHFKAKVQQMITTDKVIAYVNEEFRDFLSTHRIAQKSSCDSCPNTLLQNVVTKIRMFIHVQMSMMKVVPQLWSKAILTTAHFMNHTPSRIDRMETPCQMSQDAYNLSACRCSYYVTRARRTSVGKLKERGSRSQAQSPTTPENSSPLSTEVWRTSKIENGDENILKELEEGAELFKKVLDPEYLKHVFQEKIKPALTSRCITISEPTYGPEFKITHFNNKIVFGQFPKYVTSLTLMKLLIKHNIGLWDDILDSLGQQRVTVINDWGEEIAKMQVHHYDDGLVLALRSGGPGSQGYKGECDAAFYKKSETGTAALVIWHKSELFYARITRGLPCHDSGHAEAIALYLLLKFGKKLGINVFDVVTDNKMVSDFMNERLNPDDAAKKSPKIVSKKEKSPKIVSKEEERHEIVKVLYACMNLAKEYKILNIRCEPREKQGVVNAMAQSSYPQSSLKDFVLKESKLIRGVPLVRVQDCKREIISKLDKEVVHEAIQYPPSYYKKMGRYHKEHDVLPSLVKNSKPRHVIVLVKSGDLANQLSHHLEGCGYPCDVKEVDCQSSGLCSPREHCAVILINGNASDSESIPFDVADSTLILVYLNHKIKYSVEQNASKVKAVYMISDDDSNMLPDRDWKEVDYSFFGVFSSPGQREKQKHFKIMICSPGGHEYKHLHPLEESIKKHDPDLLCFHDVTPRIHWALLKFDYWRKYECSLSYPKDSHKYCYSLQMSKFPVNKFSTQPKKFPTMPDAGDDVCVADVRLTNEKSCDIGVSKPHDLVLGTNVMESTLLQWSLGELSSSRNAVLYGKVSSDKGATKVVLPEGWEWRETEGYHLLLKLSGYKFGGSQPIWHGPEKVGFVITLELS